MTSRRNDENILKGIVQETKKRFEMPENQNEANGRETPQIARSPKLTPRDTFTRNDAGQASVGLSVPQKDKYNVGVPMEPREVKHLTQPADEDKEFDLKNLKGNVDKKKKNFDTPGNAAGAQPDRQVQHQFQAGNQNQAKGRETPQTTRSPELTPKNNSTRNDANRKLHQGVLQVKEKQLQDPREAGGGKKNSAGTEKKMEERLKAEIQGSQEAIKKLLDEKLNGFQTLSEAQLRNQIERLTAELSCIDQKVSLEIERKLNTIERMQFASRDELQEQISLLDKKLSTSEPNLEINYVEKKLDHLKKLELEKVRTELDWRRARNNADDITLDADTAHPNLSIAGDKKSFTYAAQPQKVRTTPQRFDSTVCVLGSEVFSKGKHYWEVDVESSTDWDLGVARKSVTKKGKLSLCPKEGFWVLGQSGRDYWVKTDPWTRVMVQKKPKKIGVYLSYQERQVTFFNVNDMSVLFIFKNCSFSEEVCPFFKNSHKETTMQICSVKED